MEEYHTHFKMDKIILVICPKCGDKKSCEILFTDYGCSYQESCRKCRKASSILVKREQAKWRKERDKLLKWMK